MIMQDYQPQGSGYPQGFAPQGNPNVYQETGREGMMADPAAVLDLLDTKKHPSSHGLTKEQLEDFAQQARDQPEWRDQADEDCEYYDHHQRVADWVKQSGQKPITKNLVFPTINLVLGIYEQNQRDWKVDYDNDDQREVALGLSVKLKELERTTRADNAQSDSFASAVKCGLGWTEVTTNPNPFEFPHRIREIHRREMWFDWLTRDYRGMSDCMWQVRRRWFPLKYLQTVLPPKIVDALEGARQGWPTNWFDPANSASYVRHECYEEQRNSTLEELEWMDRTNSRACLYEINHRVFHRGLVLRIPDGSEEGRVVEFDTKNPLHLEIVNSGMAKPEPAVYSKIRESLWAGPHRIKESGDVPNRFRYVPWWGFREDKTGSPYGLIRGMRDQQDEVNAHRQMAMWYLAAIRLVMHSDALDLTKNTVEDVLENIRNPTFPVFLNPMKREAKFEVQRETQMAGQHYEWMTASENGMQASAGVYHEMLGKQSSATSGIAINQLVTQGTTGLAKLFGNAEYSHHLVGELALEQIRERIKGKQVQVVLGEKGRKQTIIILNQPAVDEETGIPYLKNDTERSKTKLALTDVPSSPSFRQQQQQQLMEIIRSASPEAQAIMIPYWVERSDDPDKYEIAEQLRNAFGIKAPSTLDPGQDPEKLALMQQVEELTAQIQQLMASPEIAKVDLTEAQTEKTKAETDVIKLKAIDMLNGEDEDEDGPIEEDDPVMEEEKQLSRSGGAEKEAA